MRTLRDPRRSTTCPAPAVFTTDVERTLKTPGLEAVVVATPPATHRNIIERAISQGLQVSAEKPIAETLDDADAILAAVDEGASVFIGHVMRFDPRYLAVRKALESGALGEPLSVLAWLNSDVSERDYYASRTTLARELAVHHLDVMRWLAGDVTNVYANAASSESGERSLETCLVATLRFRSGAIGCLQISWAQPRNSGVDHGLSFLGTAGLARVNGAAPDTFFYPAIRSANPREAGEIPDATRREVEAFLARVRERRDTWPLSPGDARAALAAALALEESLATQAPVGITG